MAISLDELINRLNKEIPVAKKKRKQPEFVKPVPGEFVRVTIDMTRFMKSQPVTLPRMHKIIGTVIPSLHFDDPKSFRVSTGNRVYPIALCNSSFVDKIEVIATEKSFMLLIREQEPSQPKFGCWQVGSNSDIGKFYTVIMHGPFYHCMCMGYVFKGTCKHIETVKTMKPV